MAALIDCQCGRYPETPCRVKADAEDLLCSICRPRDCVIFTMDTNAGRFAASGVGPAHARMYIGPANQPGITVAVQGGRFTRVAP